MADITIQILPLLEGRKPAKFRSEKLPKSSAVIGSLVQQYGPGTLTDWDDATVLPEEVDPMKAGIYTFTLSSIPQGNHLHKFFPSTTSR